MQETCPTTQSLHISTNDVPYGYLSPDSISSDETCDSDTSDASWPVISPVTSEDEHSAKDSYSESGNDMLEADGDDSVANFQDGDISSPCNSQYALTRQLAAHVTHTCFAKVLTMW